MKDFEGEHGRLFNEFELVGSREYVTNDESGNLVVYHHQEETVGTVVEASDKYAQLMSEYQESLYGDMVFENEEGDPLESRDKQGTHILRMIPIESLVFLGDDGNRLRKGDLQLMALQDSISQVGQLSPIHVVPLGSVMAYAKDELGQDILELPIYSNYMVLDGVRRVEVFANLGIESIEAMVDTTIPHPLMYFYQTVVNERKTLTFREKMGFIQTMRELQPRTSPSMLEYAVGFKLGELPKAEFVESMQVDFPDVYTKLVREKITIEQAFKAIDRELAKRDKEEAVSADVPEPNTDLAVLERDVKSQELGDRHILDTNIRRTVEARDGSCCQVCGYAKGIPERADTLKAHHMVAVQYGGSDDPSNLIMLCSNCHEEVHKYEMGRLVYSVQNFNASNDIKRIVVLGNILRKARAKAIEVLRRDYPSVASKMDSGKLTVGKALMQSKAKLGVEEALDGGSPYQAYRLAVGDLEFGGVASGELASLELEDTPADVEVVEVGGDES